MRVVLDSNVLLSALGTRGVCSELYRDVLKYHELLVSEYILSEVHEKLVIKFKVPMAQANSVVDLLRPYCITGFLEQTLNLKIRDPKDVAIVVFAMSVEADVLITGDKELLDVVDVLPIKTLSPRQFYDLFRKG